MRQHELISCSEWKTVPLSKTISHQTPLAYYRDALIQISSHIPPPHQHQPLLCGKSDCDFKGPLSEMKALPVSISVTVCVRSYWGKTQSAAEHPTVTNRLRAQAERPPFLFLTKAIKWQTNSFIALPNLSISPFSWVTAGLPWPSVFLDCHLDDTAHSNTIGVQIEGNPCFLKERALWLADDQRESSVLCFNGKMACSIFGVKGHISSITQHTLKGSSSGLSERSVYRTAVHIL